MFFYFFDRHHGHDRVAQSKLEWVSAGDFLEIRWYGYVLSLGDDISRVEQYTQKVELWLPDAEILLLEPKLLSAYSLQVLHRFTHHRFCSYKKAIPLWISDPEELAKRKTTKKKARKKWAKPQALHIYPNLWSLSNHSSLYSKQEWSVILHSQSTKKQKAEAFWSIKNGDVEALVCTYSQMFQDWHELDQITLYDQHTRYYKSQKDPRYHAVTAAQYIANIYSCQLDMSWFSLV